MSSVKLTEEQVKEIVYEVNDDYFLVEKWITGTSRWNVFKTGVITSGDGKYYMIDWNEGATERQENEFWSQAAQEVEQQEVVVKKWKAVK